MRHGAPNSVSRFSRSVGPDAWLADHGERLHNSSKLSGCQFSRARCRWLAVPKIASAAESRLSGRYICHRKEFGMARSRVEVFAAYSGILHRADPGPGQKFDVVWLSLVPTARRMCWLGYDS